jgi:c-di-GMP-binding flagellar brake protein YcgR
LRKNALKIDRRQFKRVKADILCRAAPFSLSRKSIQDIGIGGLRVYSDEKQKIGKKLDIELFPVNQESISCRVKVVWMNMLADDAIAKFEIGLAFLKVHPRDLIRLKSIISEHQKTPV